ncbi:2OG-Fe(II) oxygenase [Aurantiacibacter sp. MUD61]|uniref:2OG-Fe(II) oxygenase n=1 Tax=Aurantiacibacter sp. MUD61 TaxID=3009083 RepID=UPI0022F04DDA|nr:2OG-Fe(II) oxygenase [Aurantiacibacter sp. MUD61]
MASEQSAFSRIPAHLCIPDFLPGKLHQAMLDFMQSEEAGMEPSLVRGGVPEDADRDRRVNAAARRSMSSSRSCPHADALWDIVAEHMSHVLDTLGVVIPENYATEGHCVAHGDGDFFRAHRDIRRGDARNNHRLISLVWYAHNQPKAFSGGNLRLYALDQKASVDIEPQDNMAVFFPSYAMHEVREVCVPSGAFADRRFAYVGWVTRPSGQEAE